MRKSLWIALKISLALAVTLLVPVRANANPLDSFANGFDDLVNPKTDLVVEDPTEDYDSRYEPQEVELRAPAVNELPEDATVLDYVTNTVDKLQRFSWGSYTNTSLLYGLMYFLAGAGGVTMPQLVLGTAAGLVFMWWGVRKTKQIIWTAFRTGRLNLGTSVKRAWYRHKAKEWYG